MIGTSWTGTNRSLVFDEKITVLDECQISSSEYLDRVIFPASLVLDECQISSSEYETGNRTGRECVLDECQISSSEYSSTMMS